MKVVIADKVPPGYEKLAGKREDLSFAELEALEAKGVQYVTAAEFDAKAAADVVKAAAQAQVKTFAESAVKGAVAKAIARGAVAAKDEKVLADALAKAAALDYKPEGVELVVARIDAMEAPKRDLSQRVTASDDGEHRVEVGEAGFRETVKEYLKASEPFQKELKNGGIVRAAHMDDVKMKDAMKLSQHRAVVSARLAEMIVKGADLSAIQMQDVVRAGDYADPASNNPLGVLNTGMLLQWNLGFLANQLAILDDITTDVTGQPVLFNQMVRSRYTIVPKVQLKSSTNAWTAGTGTDVDVNVTMDTHAGVPISINNNVLSATPRQLFNEQRQPQLYGLGEYITYKLIHNIFNGNTRVANDASTTSTIVFNATTNTYSVAGATLANFVADIPEKMDELKMPGGDEQPGEVVLQRFLWVHGRVYALAAADTNFMLNNSIQGIRGQTTDNVMATGRYERIGNMKFRKSQLVTDQCAVSGSGADATTNGITVSAGTYTSATYVGFGCTRSALMFVSRVPLDYTKVLPDVPSTAAIEMVTEPKTGLTFLVVKYLDHAYETANVRVQLMFGTAIGDERQGLLIKRT